MYSPDTQWASQMAEAERRELDRQLGMVRNRVEAYKEFAGEAGVTLAANTIKEITKTTDALCSLVMEWS